MESTKSVLFVCLGNICRSPMAEAILKEMVSRRHDKDQWEIDSCGTGDYHIGQQPYRKCLSTLESHGIKGFRSTVRKLKKSDFSKFQWIFVFDKENVLDVKQKMPKSSASKLQLIRQYDPVKESENPVVIDPYYEEDAYFETCYKQCFRSLENFLSEEYKIE